MILNVISSTVSVNKWGETEGTRNLCFEVVPKDRGYLEIGDKYVFASAGYYRLLHKDRQPVTARLSVTADRSYLERKDEKLGKDVCGWAAFYPERKGQIDYDPATLELVVVVEPQRFEELFNLRIRTPDATTMHISIEGLEYGWEPDGSHEIWKRADERVDLLADRKPITSFWISVRTFETTEQAIENEIQRKRNQEFAESPDSEMRKLADPTPPAADAAATNLLEHCRVLLIAILAVAVFALLKR